MWHTVTKSARRAGTAACLALAMALAAAPAWGRGEPSIKIGINRVVISGSEYAHQDATGTYTDSEVLSGTDLMFEWVASDHFSLEITSAVTPLRRSYELGPTGSVAANVNETVGYTLIGANLYFTRTSTRGIQYLLGVSTGTATVKHEFEGGTVGTVSTSNTVPVSAIRFAVDWVTELAGVRLQYQGYSGTTSNTTQIVGTKQTVNFTGNALGIGVYAFF
jgi:hypothetical protein